MSRACSFEMSELSFFILIHGILSLIEGNEGEMNEYRKMEDGRWKERSYLNFVEGR